MIREVGEILGEVSHPSWIIPGVPTLPISLTWGVRRIGEVGWRFRSRESSCGEYEVAVLVVRERMTESPSVVIVDPDETFARMVVTALRPNGCECLVVKRPEDANRELATGRHEVLVVNLDTAGATALASVAQDRGVAVVAVTSRPSVEGALSAFRGGATDYLPTPIRKVDLIAAVDRAAAKSRALRVVRRVEKLLGACTRWFRDLETLLTIPGGFSVPVAVRDALTERRDGSALDQLLVRCLGVHEVAALTRRERDVLLALAQGKRGRDLATCLGVSVNTCRTHLKSVLRKLGVRSQQELLSRLGGGSSGQA